MNRREKTGVLFGLILAAAALFFLIFSAREEKRYDHVFPVMGTRAEISVYSRKVPEDAIRAAVAAINGVNAVCSRFDQKSELSRLNRHAATAPFVCSNMLWEVLTHARRAHRISGGAFDITVEPLMKLWGFYRRQLPGEIPSPESIAGAKKLVGMEKISFDDRRKSVFFTVPGMTIDLGGIAKGYAVDRAAAVLEAHGIRRGVVDIGGNLRFLPLADGSSESYRVGIRHPSSPDKLAAEVLTICGGKAVATSGNYERFVILQGKRFGHLIDPVSGTPASPDYAATVTAPDAVTADWLSTTGFLRGPEIAAGVEKLLPDVKFVFISSGGETVKF